MTTDPSAENGDSSLMMTPLREPEFIASLDLRLQCLANPMIDGVASAVVVRPDELDLVSSAFGDTDDVVGEVRRRIVAAVHEANAEFLRQDVRFLEDYGVRRSVRLKDGDSLPIVNGENSTRKLVLFLPLFVDTRATGESRDLTAVRVEFAASKKVRPVTAGELLIFPAFMMPLFSVPVGHELGGFVLYAHGPAFR